MTNCEVGEAWIHSKKKRHFDLGFIGIASPLVFVACAVGAAAVAFEDHVNPLLIQQRFGSLDDPLNVIKVRTMPEIKDGQDGSLGYADPRASRVGKMLRKYCIDDLPQAWNIARGHMSVVGPRPLVRSDIENTLDLLSAGEQRDWLQARKHPGWIDDFGLVSRELQPQSAEYLLKRVEMNCSYYATATYEHDIHILKGLVGIGVNHAPA